MKKSIINISGESGLRFNITIKLDKMNIILERKEKNYQLQTIIEENVIVDLNTDMAEVLKNMYERFLEKKDVQYYWNDWITNAKIFEYNHDINEEENSDV